MVQTPAVKDLYRPDEVAAALEVSLRTVYRWINEGHIRHIHCGRKIRIRRGEMERVLREGVDHLSCPVM